jgi:hypothetical protein
VWRRRRWSLTEDLLGSLERIPAPQRLPNNIIHPTRAREVASGNSCFGRVMMSVGQTEADLLWQAKTLFFSKECRKSE